MDMTDPRATFARTAARLVEEDLSVALVYAEISGQYFADVERAHPDRVINVGIREQLLVNVGAGLALTGMRPIVHTFSSFLVERAFEQVKLGFSHQDVGGVLVGSGGSLDISGGGRTHQAPGDVALIDTLPDWTIHVPGHAEEVESALRLAVAGDGRDYVRVVAQQNRLAFPVRPGRFHVVRQARGAVVLAVGPMLEPVLAATEDLDVTVLYANVVRPFDAATLRAVLGSPEVVLVEPYLAGTSARLVADALVDRPHRLLSLGVGREELRRYGTPEQHLAARGLDASAIRGSITRFLEAGSPAA
jgi:transketolase